MLPDRAKALALLQKAEACNPGPWGDHSRTAAHCAEKIAIACGMDGEKAYVLGLLHDIGRKFGVRHLGHVTDGYRYMLEQGYDEAARICLTHSFSSGELQDYIGKKDVSEDEYTFLQFMLSKTHMDDYDRLIQLCDALAGNGKVLNIEERMGDVKRRYGFYPPEKWAKNIELKEYFQKKAGQDIYFITEKDTFAL